ncbi:MAG: universal stress protein [Thermoleophilia bacterium]|nr:universal stress protein [Thermoleophilia bacterium]
MIKKILVPTDGSELAENAADFAIDMAKNSGASLIFLNVVDEVSPAFAYELESGASLDMTEIQRQRDLAAQDIVERLRKHAESAGLPARGMVTNGHPSEQILEVADRENASHIVIGSHGRRALAAAVLGNVTFNVIHGSKVPVTVIPRPK